MPIARFAIVGLTQREPKV